MGCKIKTFFFQLTKFYEGNFKKVNEMFVFFNKYTLNLNV